MNMDALTLVREQAEDDGLWFRAQTASEAYLQQELRRLHAVVEADLGSSADEGRMPMQPVVVAPDGCVRFLQNRIVRDLLEHGQKTGLGLNELACGDYYADERMQLAQLLGYTVSGYGGLSYVSAESCALADERARSLTPSPAAPMSPSDSEADRRDAARYRWLRSGRLSFKDCRSILNDTPHGIDAAVDAAMEKDKQT